MSRRLSLLSAFLLLYAALAFLYRSVPDNPLIFDSSEALQDGDFVQQTYATTAIFTPRWIPFKSFAWIYRADGPDMRRQYALNIALHAANALLLFLLCRALLVPFFKPDGAKTGRFLPPADAWALFLSALFAFHPVSVYAAAYLVQRTILFATFFGLLSALAFARAFTGGKKIFYLFSLIAFLAATHSKEHAAVLPAVFALLAVYLANVTRRPPRETARELILPMAGYAVIAFDIVMQSRSVLMKVYEPHGESILDLSHADPARAYLLSTITQAFLFFRYLGLWFLPDVRRMSIDAYWPFPEVFPPWPEILGAAAFPALLAASLRLLARKHPAKSLLGLALAAPMTAFLPEFSTVRISEIFVLYRAYFWMPLALLSLPALAGLIGGRSPPALKRAAPLAAFLAVVFFASAARDRLATFETASRAWRDAVDKISSQNDEVPFKAYRTYNNYANALAAEHDFDGAVAYYLKSVAINPRYIHAHSNLGSAYSRKQEHAKAEAAFRAALALDPNFTGALVGLGVVAAATGKSREALEYYQRAVRIDPREDTAYFNAGNVYMSLAKYDKAERMYRSAVGINPHSAKARFNLGAACHRLGRLGEALGHYEAAAKMDPKHVKAREASAYLRGWLEKHPQTEP